MMTESANVVHLGALQSIDNLANAINMEIRMRFEKPEPQNWGGLGKNADELWTGT